MNDPSWRTPPRRAQPAADKVDEFINVFLEDLEAAKLLDE
jgi:hypothetical protein